MNSQKKISVVIPVLNEEKSLPELLSALSSQTFAPNEILFIDAGSTDQSKAIIGSWATENLLGLVVKVIDNPKGMPGANRNIGIQHANQGNWIAFLDAGITPRYDWLSSLVTTAENTNQKAVFGQCEFHAYTAFQTAVCALSYGCTSKSVLPNSLFHSETFNLTGLFRGDLRAAEDGTWLAKFDATHPQRVSTPIIVSEYTHFPQNVAEVLHKWDLYELNANLAGLTRKKVDYLILYFLVATILLFINSSFALLILLLYLFTRGLIDPIYRSKNIFWWRKYPTSFLHALYLAPLIDLAICRARIRFVMRK